MDNQNVLVIGAAILGIVVFGGIFLSGPDRRDSKRPTYAVEDIRYKYQLEDLKKKKSKKTTAQAPAFATGNSSSSGSRSTSDTSGGDNEEPSVFDHEPQEEPPLD